MAYGRTAVIKTQHQLQATAGRVLLGSSAGWMSLHAALPYGHSDGRGTCFWASCQHKPAGLFGVTKSELSACKQAICTVFSHKEAFNIREALTLLIPRLLLASSWVTQGHLPLRINQQQNLPNSK